MGLRVSREQILVPLDRPLAGNGSDGQGLPLIKDRDHPDRGLSHAKAGHIMSQRRGFLHYLVHAPDRRRAMVDPPYVFIIWQREYVLHQRSEVNSLA